ncbi:MAG: hypothetical protein CSA65_06670 [Proteobacteria bacterium]|nr:MAG: hypothetical protein CSB49_00350 [Pseudomonadota bacterium]PIE17964.1 MAG: hypothetical protein CSA65_06670 [Pseudomonadota bacterium]
MGRKYLWGPIVIGSTLASLAPSPALAKSERALDYSFKQVWSTAVRMIRVDRGYPVSDKDKDNGYILFVFPGKGSVKKCAASLELVQTKDPQGFEQIKLKLRIQHQPSWVELQFLDHLERKLRSEQGPPPPKRVRKPKKRPAKPKKKPGRSRPKG